MQNLDFLKYIIMSGFYNQVTYVPKTVTQSQQNYTQIEKEMLAILFRCTRFHDYMEFQISGRKGITTVRSYITELLDQAPARFLRMIIAIQKYSITVDYRPGTELAIADTLYLEHSYQEHRKIQYMKK